MTRFVFVSIDFLKHPNSSSGAFLICAGVPRRDRRRGQLALVAVVGGNTHCRIRGARRELLTRKLGFGPTQCVETNVYGALR